jgi:hypothetical protein
MNLYYVLIIKFQYLDRRAPEKIRKEVNIHRSIIFRVLIIQYTTERPLSMIYTLVEYGIMYYEDEGR